MTALRQPDRLGNARMDTTHASLEHRPRTLQLDQKDLIHFFRPAPLGPAAQAIAREQARPVVVRPEVSRTRMGNVYRDKGNIGFEILGGDGRSDAFVGLKFDHQIHLFSDQVVGSPKSRLRLIPVVDHDEFYVIALSGARKARLNLAIERSVLPLSRITNA